MAGKTTEPGTHLAAAFGERGAPLDAAEARRVLELLVRLHELGALVFDDEGSGAVHQSPAPEMAGGCGQVRNPDNRLPVTNRQPSKYASGGES